MKPVDIWGMNWEKIWIIKSVNLNRTVRTRTSETWEFKRSSKPRNNLVKDENDEHGARGSVEVKALCYKPEGRGFDTRLGELLKIYLILPVALGPGVYSVPDRNEYQKH
jgi:hypothetical protein